MSLDDWLRLIGLIAGICMLLATFYAWYVKHMLAVAGPASFPDPPLSPLPCVSPLTEVPDPDFLRTLPTEPYTVPPPNPRNPPITLETYVRLVKNAISIAGTASLSVPPEHLEPLLAYFEAECEAGRLALDDQAPVVEAGMARLRVTRKR